MSSPFLGELELAVMEHLWARGPGDVKELHRAVGKPRRITLNTVQSTLKRLYEKGHLRRTKVSHAYLYEPARPRSAFQRHALGEALELLRAGGTDAMLSAFVDLTERAGPENLERLERMIQQRLREDGGGGR